MTDDQIPEGKTEVAERLTEAVQEMTKQVVELVGQVKQLVASDKRRKWQIIGLFATLLIDFALSIGMVYAIVKADDAQTRTYDLCVYRNEQADKQHLLWDGIIAMSMNQPNQTPEQRATTEQFKKTLDEAYQKAECE